MEKAVKGATKIKLAAPKSKYVESILGATAGGESGVAEVFRTLQLRLRDSTWTIVFKSLIIVHLMIREGSPEVTLRFLADSPKRMAISQFTEVQTQGVSIRRYYEYLLSRVKAYRDAKTDHVRTGAGQLKSMTVDKGLLRQTEIVQEQIKTLLKCDMLGSHDSENEINITAFRLITMDLLELFKVMNEGTINVLECYFEMSKPDAERALNIYKSFARQTDQIVQYLVLARQYETYTKLEVPKLKHAPTTLTASLQEYLNDPDFEINRRQYLAQQEAKRTGKPIAKPVSNPTPVEKPAPSSTATYNTRSGPGPGPGPGPTQARGPAPDLIDFFESIDQNQQQMAHSVSPQQQQFSQGYVSQQPYQMQQQMPQSTGYNPFLQQQQQQQQTGDYSQPFFSPQQQQQQQQPQSLQPDFTGAGFGGYGPQPTQQPQHAGYAFSSQLTSIPQDGVATFQQEQHPTTQPFIQPQQTSTNPFRQSVMHSEQPTANTSILNRQSTNPFAKSAAAFSSYDSNSNPQPFASSPPPLSSYATPEPVNSVAQPLQAQRTGTNPFAKNRSPTIDNSPIAVNITGSTNPFRQSQFVSQVTGTGWQHSNQGTFAGFDMNAVETKPVFPRPGQN